MNIKIVIVILAAVCAGLVIALVATKKQAGEQTQKAADAILDFSNQLTTANVNLDDLRQVNLMLTNDIAASHEALLALSNNFTETSGALTETKASLQSAQDQIGNLNGRIADLEAQNKALDDHTAALTNTIASLDSQIADVQQQLASSETNNVFLTAELQKQMAQRAELEHKFNDLNDVRAQVKKLRDELFVARRLQWISAGTSGTQQKGAELLMHGPPTGTAPGHPPHYDLNVEVGSDGSVHLIPPITNAPPQ
jgi:predicted RNase H-like nuclease (RuvC/YqgF family)